MGKRNCHTSKRALGVLYNEVVRQTIEFHPDWKHAFDPRILSRYALDDELIQTARKIKRQYDVSVRRILAQLDVETEFELYTGWSMSPPAIGSDYKRQEDLGREYDALKARFREICYEAVGSTDDEKLDRFVAAMYKVTEEEMQAPEGRDGSEKIPDAKAGTTPRRIKRVPKGTSEYQAAWIIDDDDGEEDNGVNEDGHGEDGSDVGMDDADREPGQDGPLEEEEEEEMEDLQIGGTDADSASQRKVHFEDLDMDEENRQ